MAVSPPRPGSSVSCTVCSKNFDFGGEDPVACPWCGSSLRANTLTTRTGRFWSEPLRLVFGLISFSLFVWAIREYGTGADGVGLELKARTAAGARSLLFFFGSALTAVLAVRLGKE